MFRILLVDDDEDMREITKRWLSKSYEVSQAASGEEAVHFLKQNGADLALLLEQAGRNRELAVIQERTGELLLAYRALAGELAFLDQPEI